MKDSRILDDGRILKNAHVLSPSGIRVGGSMSQVAFLEPNAHYPIGERLLGCNTSNGLLLEKWTL